MAEDQQNPNVEQEVGETITLKKPAKAETGNTNVESVPTEEAPENKTEIPESAGGVESESVSTDTAEEGTEPAAEVASVAEDTAEDGGANEEIPAPLEEMVIEEPASESAFQDESVVEEEATPEASEKTHEEDAVAETESGSVDVSTVEESGDTLEEAVTEETTVLDEPVPMLEIPEGMIGYTGKITDDVVKLEDLDSSHDPDADTVGLEELRNLVESTLTHVSEHEIVTGRIVSLGEKDVVIDIGFKSDGIVSRSEFEGELSVGVEVEVYLERIEDYHGQLVLSKTKADTVRRWRRIETAFESEEVIEGTIVRRIKGGMIVELFEGMEAFLPGSQIDVRPVRDFDSYLEKRMEFKIVKLNPINENIVVSHKALIEKDLQEQRETILSSMVPGQILEGTVKNITDFGVFIDLGGVDGLLHITDLSWGRVSHPSELVSLDEQLNIVVLDYDKERQRISLGLKQLQPHPWENIEEKYDRDSVVEGKVVSITDYGAFVELEKGIEGLVHISEMSWTEHIRHPSQTVSLGQLVNVKILAIDTEGKKISLGMKQLGPDPWDDIAENYPPGTIMRGKVRNITNFGVFVAIEPGIDGLVHISDLSWTKRIRHPSEMVKKGDELEVVVLNIDTSDRRISLGHKQVDTNPWKQFAQVFGEGQRSDAKVVRHENEGVVVELPMDVEAFVPGGELRNQSQISEAYPIGHQMEDLLIIRFSPGQKEIILSETASERVKVREERKAEDREKRQVRQKEKREISRYRQKEAATGPTTLGELSGLADLKAKLEAEESQTGVKAKPEAEASDKPEPPVEIKLERPEKVETDAQTDAEVEAETQVSTLADAQVEAPVEETESTDGKEAVAEKKPPKAEPKTKAKAEPKAKAKAEPKAKAETKAESKAKAETKAEPKAKAETKAESKAKAEPKAKSKAKAETKAESKVKADKAKAEPKTKAELKPKAKAETKTSKASVKMSKGDDSRETDEKS